jgi:glycosyltransferase involved in cell wall biosynthesis
VADAGRIAFVCDMHADYAVGGAQRFYATLAQEFALQDQVTYLTRRFWPGPATRTEGAVEVIGLIPAPEAGAGGRGMAPKLTFAVALLWHLLRHGARYRVVHVCCFPHVALVAARLGLLPHRATTLVGDWHEVLPRATWRRRLGRVGDLGWLAQRAAINAGQAAITFSRMHRERLQREGRRHGIHLIPEFPTEEVRVAEGGDDAPGDDAAREKLIVFAGRLVAEKRPHLIPAVLAELQRDDPAWRAEVFGTGRERERVEAEAQRLGVSGAVRFAGFAEWSELSGAMLRASALVLPTEREGFGLVVLEASGHGLPSVLVAAGDNAAVELIDDGVNGHVCASADPGEQARAVLALAADDAIHERTRAWYEEHRARFSVATCAAEIRAVHRAARGG